MYLPGFSSCSSLIHLIARFPIGVLAMGILVLTSYLVSPVGPGVHFGAAGILSQQEEKILESNPALRTQLVQVRMAFEQTVVRTPLSDSAIKYVLDRCQDCRGVSPEEVRDDPALMSEVAFLYFLDLVQQHGLGEAKVLYANQR